MSVRAVLRKVWNDSVWSKVIAAGITAALAAVGSLAFAHWNTLAVLAELSRRVPVPLWLMLLVGLAFVALAFHRFRVSGADDDAQPNAVPIATVDMLFLERPFESLSARQQRFLARQFSHGARVFRVDAEVKDAAWFAELVKWHYLAPRTTLGSDSSCCEITPAGWQELERVRSEAGLPAR